MIETEIKQWGNSLGVILPRERLKELGIHKGDQVDIDIVQKKRRNGFGLCRGARPFTEEKEPHQELWS